MLCLHVRDSERRGKGGRDMELSHSFFKHAVQQIAQKSLHAKGNTPLTATKYQNRDNQLEVDNRWSRHKAQLIDMLFSFLQYPGLHNIIVQ